MPKSESVEHTGASQVMSRTRRHKFLVSQKPKLYPGTEIESYMRASLEDKRGLGVDTEDGDCKLVELYDGNFCKEKLTLGCCVDQRCVCILVATLGLYVRQLGKGWHFCFQKAYF